MHNSCFVIQPFDGGVYDRRYKETFAPAIEAGGAKPVRADEVLGTRPVIEKIEAGLKETTIAFADASENNANVFLEIGYALALNVPIVIICDKAKRERLPFDIQHRPVLFYLAQAQSDFEKIGSEITKNVRAALSESSVREKGNPSAANDTNEIGESVRRACLLELLDQDLRDPDGASLWSIQRKVVGPGVNERMVALVVQKLISEGGVEKFSATDRDSGELYVAIRLTDHGRNKLLREYSSLMRSEMNIPINDFISDDIPF